MIIEALIWLFFIYAVFRFVRSAIQNAVRRGIRDYEVQKENQQRSQNEVKVDPKKIQDADYEDLK
jgi:uncharacterized protein YicC (UPF0701 family)